jgi:hypothetical protein
VRWLTIGIDAFRQHGGRTDHARTTPVSAWPKIGRQHMRDTLVSRILVLLGIWIIALTPLFFM